MTIIARARVILDGDSIKLTKAMQGAVKTMEQAGKRISAVGKSLTTKVALPVLAIGGISVKMAATFDASMRKIVGLVGVNRDIVDGWRGDMRRLAVQYATSANEVADAMFFITSAGLRGARALETLEAALKASAAGMGETKIVADAATSAMNAYSKMGLTATRATEILTAGVRKGKLEAEDLAPVMGLITGTAAGLNISFEDLVGTLAVFSRTGTQASVGATQLNSIMATLLGTSQEGEKALSAAGLSLDNLRAIAAQPGGLLAVMRLLEETFAGNLDALKIIIPNLRAFRGVMNALAQDAAAVDDVMDGVRNSIGILDEAFLASKGPLFQMKQAWEIFKELLMTVGDILIPAVVPTFSLLAGGIAAVTKELERFSPGGRAAIVVLVGLAVTLGPVLLLLGKAILLIKGMAVASALAIKNFALFSRVFLPGGILLIGLGLLGAAWLNAKEAAAEAESAMVAATDSMKAAFSLFSADKAAATIERLDGVMGNLQATVDDLRKKQKAAEEAGIAGAFSKDARAARESAVAFKERADALQETIDRQGIFRDVLAAVVAQQEIANAAIKRGGGQSPQMLAAKEAMILLGISLKEAATLNDLLGDSFDITAAKAESYNAAIGAMVQAGVDVDMVLNEQGDTLRTLAAEYSNLAAQVDGATDAQMALEAAQADAKRILESILTPTEIYTATVAALDVHLAKGRLLQDEHNRAVAQAQQALNDASESATDWGQTVERMTSLVLDGFLRFTMTARGSFKEFIDSTIQDLLRLTARMAIAGLFKSAGLPGFAHGGFLAQGSLGIVGEAGPELIRAGHGGASIQPIRGMVSGGARAGGEPPINANVTIHAVDAKSFAQLIESNPQAVTVPVIQAIVRSQALRRTLGG